MAGGGEALGAGGGREKRGKSKRKKKHRLGFKLDMTPLVDITFLLLTFFMFTTTMMKPQIMEMKIPPESEPVDVAVSKLFTILVNDNGDIYYYYADEEAKKIKLSELSKILIKKNLEPDLRNELITVLKVSDKAKYEDLIKVLDELNLAESVIIDEMSKEINPETGMPMERKRKFTIAPFTDEDRAKIDPNFIPPDKENPADENKTN